MCFICKCLGLQHKPQQQQIQSAQQQPLMEAEEKCIEDVTLPPPDPDSQQPISPTSNFHWVTNTLKALSTSALVVDIIFAVFLFQAVKDAVDYGTMESGVTNKLLKTSLIAASGILAFMNTVCDATIVNPIEDSEAIVSSSSGATLDAKLTRINACELFAVRTLSSANQVLALAPFIIGAAGDALGFAYLVKNPIFRWSSGVPTTALGVLFYILLTRVRINEHAYEFIHRLFDCKSSMLVNAVKSPLKSLEVIIQALSNSLYRGVGVGYIMRQLLLMLFARGEKESSNIYYILAATAASIYITLFSRTLNVHKEMFNEKFSAIPPEIFNRIKVSKIGLGIDMLMTTLRALPTFALITRHVAADKYMNYLFGGLGFALVGGHGLYVRYTTRLAQTALRQMEKEQLLSLSDNSASEAADLTSAADLFESIKQRQKTDTLRHAVTVFNAGGRIARSAAFLGFLVTLNHTLEKLGFGFKLGFIDLLCLHQLWGNTTFENETSFYQYALEDNWAYYKTKCLIEKAQHSYSCNIIPVCFWRSQHAYPIRTLKRALSLMDDEKRAHEVGARVARPRSGEGSAP